MHFIKAVEERFLSILYFANYICLALLSQIIVETDVIWPGPTVSPILNYNGVDDQEIGKWDKFCAFFQTRRFKNRTTYGHLYQSALKLTLS